MSEVTTLRHLSPVIGLTMHDINDFEDLVTKANDVQLQAMKQHIEQKQVERWQRNSRP